MTSAADSHGSSGAASSAADVSRAPVIAVGFRWCCPGLVGGAASSVLPGCDVAAAFSWLLVGGAGLPANRLALRAAPLQPCRDPLGAAPGFLLGHPACERDQDILDLRGRVQPGFPDRDQDAAAVLELADQPERSFGTLTVDPVQRPYDDDLEFPGVRVVEGLFEHAPVLSRRWRPSAMRRGRAGCPGPGEPRPGR